MKGYHKPSGVYIELMEGTPTNSALIEVALRPSPQHTFQNTWNNNPLDSTTCWRPKTPGELAAEQDEALTQFLTSLGGKVSKAIVLIGIDKELWTLADIRAKYHIL